MSLYNAIHGHNALAPVLLAMLGINPSNVPRYRDCWWDGEHIVIHTRTGGGNREFYDSLESCKDNYPDYFNDDRPTNENPSGPWNADLQALPTYVRDEDDDYDSTYANFYFSVPAPMQWVVPHLSAQDKTPGERWQGFMDKMRDPASADDPQVQRALGAMGPLFEQITEFLKKPEAGDAQNV